VSPSCAVLRICLASIIVGAVLFGCEAEPALERLVLPSSEWTWATSAADPRPDHRPETVTCVASSLVTEPMSIALETDHCNSAVLEQTLPNGASAGQELVVEWSHLRLWSPHGPAEGHLALAIDGRVVWERTVAIPAEAAHHVDIAILEFDAPPGSRAVFHLHNHGANEWRLYGGGLGSER
jgi:hypothetical protein